MASANRHYTLHLTVTLAAQAAAVAGIAVLLAYPALIGKPTAIALAVVLGIVWVGIMLRLVKLIRLPIRQARCLIGAMKSHDVTVRFPTTRDPLLEDVTADMNSILQSYCSERFDMEAQRQYYDRILRVMTHELRNTVAPIISLTDWMMKEEVTDTERQEAVGIIHKQADSIHSFLDSYHKLTHLPQPIMADLPAQTLADSLRKLLAGEELAEAITFKVHGDFLIRADERLLSLALLNILRNALQAISDTDGGAVSVLMTPTQTGARIVVSNNGPVIPSAQTEQIFQPFYTTRKGGSGIGLALAKQIMQLQGGTLTCESNPPLTHFIFELP